MDTQRVSPHQSEWTPSRYGYDKLVKDYGQDRADLLIEFLRLQMDQQITPLGPILRELTKLGGMFGLDDSIALAQVLSTSIAYVRGQTVQATPPDAIKPIVEALSLLILPKHSVTSLPQNRMPVWETVEK